MLLCPRDFANPYFLLVALALKKDLTAFVAWEALARKRKRSTQAVEEREFRKIQRSPGTTKAPPLPSVKKVGEVLPDLPVAMTPPFLRSVR